jgi:hypothetical protein
VNLAFLLAPYRIIYRSMVSNESSEDLASIRIACSLRILFLRLLLTNQVVSDHSQTLFITNKIKRSVRQLNLEALVPQNVLAKFGANSHPYIMHAWTGKKIVEV